MATSNMGDPSGFLQNFFQVFTKTAGKEKSELSEGNEKHFRKPSLPEGIHRQFALLEIKEATNNFDPSMMIGRGGFGYVYRGIISDGNWVAVKRLNPESKQGFNEFRTEVQLLCQLRHQHLVSLIGSCNDNDEMILVYELLKNGSLHDHLHGFHYDPLPWKQRLEICIGAARGIHYLHTGAKQTVIHRDVKSTNILLDDKWVSKLCDFGLSKMRSRSSSTSKTLKRIDTRVKGTWGYLDPEYAREQELTEKSDVYSFGVVLFEVLCARKAFDRKLNEHQANLCRWAHQNIVRGTIYNIIDPYLMGKIAPYCFGIFVDIAFQCISVKGDTRPDMGEVEVMLELALELQEKADYELAQLDHSNSTTSLGSLDTNYSSDASCNLTVEQSSDDLGQCQSSTNENARLGRASGFLKNLIKVFTKASGKGKSELSEGNEKHFRKPSTAALPEGIHRQFSLMEIIDATNYFDSDLIIDRGGFGDVYQGFISYGNWVAVKRLHPNSKQGFKKFRTEVQLLCQLHHQHLVSLIGSCNENGEMILVYELIKNGTLYDHLHGSGYDPLPWKQRLGICIGAARGLHYLHTGANQTVIHRNINSLNILLDDKWVCKLCDFGLPMMRSCSMLRTLKRIDTVVKGTRGYLDPEYARRRALTEKSDVYSFGVVLFEVLCTRKAFDPKLDKHQMHLCHWARANIVRGTIHNIIDPYMVERIAPECLKIFVDIACQCINDKGNTRPDIGEVEVMLELALEMQEKADSKLAELDRSKSTSSLGSLDSSYSSDASCNQADDLGQCQSSSNVSRIDLEPLYSLAEHSWESRCKMVEDMKNHLTSVNLACVAMKSRNFVEPLTNFLSNAYDLHDIRAQRVGLQLLSTFLTQKRSGIRYWQEDGYRLLSLFVESEVKKEALEIIQVLSARSSCRSKIAASGALSSIVDVLDSNITDFNEQAIKILCNLSSSHVVCSNLMSLECIPKLVPFLNDSTLAKFCLIVLKNLCNNNREARASVAETSGCIACIVELLETGSVKDQERVVGVLLALCSESDEYCRLVMDEGCIPVLVYVAQNGSEKGKAKVLELLRLLGDNNSYDDVKMPTTITK